MEILETAPQADGFNSWNIHKQSINRQEGFPYAHPREIWWCSLGKNIGVETDGKHEVFERPILIVSMKNQLACIALPLTSKEKKDTHHVQISYTDKNNVERNSWVKLEQIRLISTQRLKRKITTLDHNQFDDIKNHIKTYLDL